MGASDWLRSIWQDRAAFVGKPALILWGLKDIAFRRTELERWKSALQDVESHEFEDCGRFLGEEAPGRVVAARRNFVGPLVAVATLAILWLSDQVRMIAGLPGRSDSIPGRPARPTLL